MTLTLTGVDAGATRDCWTEARFGGRAHFKAEYFNKRGCFFSKMYDNISKLNRKLLYLQKLYRAGDTSGLMCGAGPGFRQQEEIPVGLRF